MASSSSFLGKRCFTTSRPLPSAVAPAQEEQKDNKFFGKFSWYPVVGLGVATAISKEIFILNDELVYASIFFAFATTMYVQLGQDAAAFFDADIQAHKDRQLDACDLAMDHVKRFITIENRQKSFPEDLKALYEDEVKMTHMAVEYQNRKHEIDTTDAVLQKLTQIKALEEEEHREFKSALISQATRYVQDKFAALPKQDKVAYIDAIIDTLPSKKGEKTPEIENDLPTRLFAAFLEENYTAEELGVVSRVASYAQKNH